MSEKEKQIAEKVKNSLPSMTEREKGYLDGLLSGLAIKQETADKPKEAAKTD